MRTLPDAKSAQIRFGVELETQILTESEIAVGDYHRGATVSRGSYYDNTLLIRTVAVAPDFNGNNWRADRDGSIRCDGGYMPAEFVSPILFGSLGVDRLLEFVHFAKMVGAAVNASCGCHITVGIPSIIGSQEPNRIIEFVRALSRIVNEHQWAIYAQTGTDRHSNVYSAPLPKESGEITNQLKKDHAEIPDSVVQLMLNDLGRGIANFRKAFPSDLSKSAVEFRAFAGTLSEKKLMHHLATVFGLCRKAAEAKTIPVFSRPDRKSPRNAPESLKKMWRYLGWIDDVPGSDIAYGQFGQLYERSEEHKAKALEMAEKFEEKHPCACRCA